MTNPQPQPENGISRERAVVAESMRDAALAIIELCRNRLVSAYHDDFEIMLDRHSGLAPVEYHLYTQLDLLGGLGSYDASSEPIRTDPRSLTFALRTPGDVPIIFGLKLRPNGDGKHFVQFVVPPEELPEYLEPVVYVHLPYDERLRIDEHLAVSEHAVIGYHDHEQKDDELESHDDFDNADKVLSLMTIAESARRLRLLRALVEMLRAGNAVYQETIDINSLIDTN